MNLIKKIFFSFLVLASFTSFAQEWKKVNEHTLKLSELESLNVIESPYFCFIKNQNQDMVPCSKINNSLIDSRLIKYFPINAESENLDRTCQYLFGENSEALFVKTGNSDRTKKINTFVFNENLSPESTFRFSENSFNYPGIREGHRPYISKILCSKSEQLRDEVQSIMNRIIKSNIFQIRPLSVFEKLNQQITFEIELNKVPSKKEVQPRTEKALRDLSFFLPPQISKDAPQRVMLFIDFSHTIYNLKIKGNNGIDLLLKNVTNFLANINQNSQIQFLISPVLLFDISKGIRVQQNGYLQQTSDLSISKAKNLTKCLIANKELLIRQLLNNLASLCSGVKYRKIPLDFHSNTLINFVLTQTNLQFDYGIFLGDGQANIHQELFESVVILEAKEVKRKLNFPITFIQIGSPESIQENSLYWELVPRPGYDKIQYLKDLNIYLEYN
jgi:hypothetical protein